MQKALRSAGMALVYMYSAGLLLLGVSALYRANAERHEYRNVRITDVDTSFWQYGEPLVPTWNSTYRVFAEDLPYPVDFSKERWDSTVKEGDTVSIECKRDFPLWGREYDGIEIRKRHE
ncbi:MAG: hypothetical protein J7K54_03965 [Candidatus Aenigmarchaeota archaeon]|nr:hypothetical protein [Candidatus Aenigmarchaeota archaeon]